MVNVRVRRVLLILALAVVLLLLGSLGGVGTVELTLWLVLLIAGLVWAVQSTRRQPTNGSSS
jgi:hypothetical protein